MSNRVAEDALAVLQENMQSFAPRRLFPDVNKLARTSTRFQNVISSERRMLADIIRTRGFEDTFGYMWIRKLATNERFFDFLVDLLPEKQLFFVEEIMETAAPYISVHVRKRMLQIWREHGNDPWKMFLKKTPSGIYNLERKTDDTHAQIHAWFDEMDAYHGIHWVNTFTFDARQSYYPDIPEGQESRMDGMRHSFFDYMVHQLEPNVMILDEVESRYDLSNVFNAIQPQFKKTPLMKTLLSYYSDDSLESQKWFLSRTDIMQPNNLRAIFSLVKNAAYYDTYGSSCDDLMQILSDSCSNYDWRVQNHQGLNAWQMCCAMESQHGCNIFLNHIKHWLESLGAHGE